MQLWKLFKALGSETRLKILQELLEKPQCQINLQKCIKRDISTISRHIRELEEVGLVRVERIGKETQVLIKNKKMLKKLLEVGECLMK